MTESRVKVGVDLFGRQVAGLPGKASDKDDQLLQISGAAADAAPVGTGKVNDVHCENSQRREDSAKNRHGWTRSQNRYNPTGKGQLAQLYSWACWLLLRRWPILRGIWLACLTLAFFLYRAESVLGLLVLGQLGESLKEALSVRKT